MGKDTSKENFTDFEKSLIQQISPDMEIDGQKDEDEDLGVSDEETKNFIDSVISGETPQDDDEDESTEDESNKEDDSAAELKQEIAALREELKALKNKEQEQEIDSILGDEDINILDAMTDGDEEKVVKALIKAIDKNPKLKEAFAKKIGLQSLSPTTAPTIDNETVQTVQKFIQEKDLSEDEMKAMGEIIKKDATINKMISKGLQREALDVAYTKLLATKKKKPKTSAIPSGRSSVASGKTKGDGQITKADVEVLRMMGYNDKQIVAMLKK